MMRAEPENCVSQKEQFKYGSRVGKLLHMMRWSRPKILNAVREFSRYMSGASLAHVKAMHRMMKSCIETSERGFLLKPTCKWDGNPAHEFVTRDRSDSDYGKDTDSRKSVSGTSSFLHGSPISTRKQHAEEPDRIGN
jgi:hypothetical protein